MRIQILIAALAFAGTTFAADKPAAKPDIPPLAERLKQCAACHGADGNGTEQFKDYPRLAGQHADFLYKALRDYQTDARKNPIMGAQAKMLDKSELMPLARYYASQKGTLAVVR